MFTHAVKAVETIDQGMYVMLRTVQLNKDPAVENALHTLMHQTILAKANCFVYVSDEERQEYIDMQLGIYMPLFYARSIQGRLALQPGKGPHVSFCAATDYLGYVLDHINDVSRLSKAEQEARLDLYNLCLGVEELFDQGLPTEV